MLDKISHKLITFTYTYASCMGTSSDSGEKYLLQIYFYSNIVNGLKMQNFTLHHAHTYTHTRAGITRTHVHEHMHGGHLHYIHTLSRDTYIKVRTIFITEIDFYSNCNGIKLKYNSHFLKKCILLRKSRTYSVLCINRVTIIIAYIRRSVNSTCVKKSGQIQPHSKQHRLG